MIQEHVHEQICKNWSRVEDWLLSTKANLYLPFSSSYDVRDSGFKVVCVDGNIFPAGFNNICQVDKDSCPELVSDYLEKHYGDKIKNILLLAEEHTKNSYYWENIRTLTLLLQASGRDTRIAIPRDDFDMLTVESSSGHELNVYPARIVDGHVQIKDFSPDLIINNNDFSNPYESWASRLQAPLNPPRELGWYNRKKSTFFNKYNQLAREFAQVIDIDPWVLQVRTERFADFDVSNEASLNKLAETISKFFEQLKTDYKDRKIEQKPFVFIKNNSGTYGLGVTAVHSPEEVLAWNYKSRKKMKASKGGGGFEEVIIQEGVPSVLQSDGATAEPTLYLIGSQLAGGFLRSHSEKGPDESLNSPGAVYKRLCVSDLKVAAKGCPMENVYGWSARLGTLAVGLETQEMGVTYASYRL